MTSNADQAQYWTAATSWVDHQHALDSVLAPVLDAVLAKAALRPGWDVLDIGCGAGTSTLAAADAVGDEGHVTGFDISPTLLARTDARSADRANISLIEGDAQTYGFEPDSVNALISRFGVMFFEDTTAAFANMARALRPGASITLAAWGPAPENPWFMIPAKVARAHLGEPPKVDRTLPGPFALEDTGRTRAMLEAAGLEVKIDTQSLHLEGGPSLFEAAELCSRVGPAASVLRHFEGSEADRLAIRAGIAEAMQRWMTDRLRIPAVVHIISAHKAH